MPHNKYIFNPTRRLAQWCHDHIGWTVAIGVLIGVLAIGSYQFAVYNTAQANKTARSKVTQLTKGACGTDKFTFQLFNNLVLDSTPHFGSPQNGPIVPGARTEAINNLFHLQRQAAAGLKKQGCDLYKIIPKDLTHD